MFLRLNHVSLTKSKMNIQYLEWDSIFFGIKIGKLEIKEIEDFDYAKLKEEAFSENYKLIYVFVFGGILRSSPVQYHGLEMVDIMLTMSRKFNKEDYQSNNYNFKINLSYSELKDCYSIAEKTSVVSRFYKDELFGPDKTKALYRKWIDNALDQSFSDGIFLEMDSLNVSGIHLIKTDERNGVGYFTLTGVNPDYKRQGIGSKLWNQSFGYWANEKEIQQIKSPFSLLNQESFKYHLKMGFNSLEEVKYIYHFRNDFDK
jgi:ribosomal protein S18 acetylase RimI-like enzyme